MSEMNFCLLKWCVGCISPAVHNYFRNCVRGRLQNMGKFFQDVGRGGSKKAVGDRVCQTDALGNEVANNQGSGQKEWNGELMLMLS